MENKRNTILLTVIAVATLLVAVVGASFAFFAVQSTSDAEVEVKATTAAASDVFNGTGTSTLSMEVTNAIMAETAKDDTKAAIEVTDADAEAAKKMTVTLEAGSGVATCTYNIKYTSTGDTYTKTPGATKEYTIQASGKTNGTADSNLAIAETNLDTATTFGPFTITDTYEEASVETTQVWDFTARFYNLTLDQSDYQLNKKYAGTFTVEVIECSNTAS